jgi:hypothetical protein
MLDTGGEQRVVDILCGRHIGRDRPGKQRHHEKGQQKAQTERRPQYDTFKSLIDKDTSTDNSYKLNK